MRKRTGIALVASCRWHLKLGTYDNAALKISCFSNRVASSWCLTEPRGANQVWRKMWRPNNAVGRRENLSNTINWGHRMLMFEHS